MKTSHVLCGALLASLLVAAIGAQPELSLIDKPTTEKSSSASEHHPPGNPFWCKSCNVFVTVFDRVLKMRDVINFLDKYFEDHVCRAMSSPFAEECLKDAPKVIPAIIEFLERLASSSLCSGLGVCQKDDLRMIAFHEQMKVNQGTKEKFELCDTCRKFAGALEDKVETFDTDDFIKLKGQIEEACDRVPPAMREKCRNMVNRYSFLFMYYLMKEKDEGNILKACEQVGICSSDPSCAPLPPFQPELIKKLAGLWIGVNDLGNCRKCLEFAGRMEGAVAEPDFKNEFGHYITSVCRYVPPIKERCTETLRAFSDKFFESLITIAGPEAICTDIGLCGEGQVPDDVRLALDMDFSFSGEFKYVQ